MYTGIKHLHSFVAYIALLILVITIIYMFIGWLQNKPFTQRSKLWAMMGLAAIHFQVLFGFILYFISPIGVSNFSKEAMGSSTMRLYILEHPLMMILAAVVITIGYSKTKRSEDPELKYRNLSLFYLLGLTLILSRIPWSSWLY